MSRHTLVDLTPKYPALVASPPPPCTRVIAKQDLAASLCGTPTLGPYTSLGRSAPLPRLSYQDYTTGLRGEDITPSYP